MECKAVDDDTAAEEYGGTEDEPVLDLIIELLVNGELTIVLYWTDEIAEIDRAVLLDTNGDGDDNKSTTTTQGSFSQLNAISLIE